MRPPFIHLRATTPYSVLEGAVEMSDLLSLCADNEMPAVGVADRNTLAGALEFSHLAQAQSIQAIIGTLLPVAESARQAAGGLVLFAKNEKGYRNLLALSSDSYLAPDDEDQPPNVSLQTICAHNEGLICLTGGVDGIVAKTFATHQRQDAKKILQTLKEAFGDRLYVELQRHGNGNGITSGTKEEQAVEPMLLDFAKSNQVPIVATNSVLFGVESFFPAHEVLLSIAANTRLTDSDRPKRTPNHRFLSAQEMQQRFADLPEAIANSVVIAERCCFFPESQEPSLPAFEEADEKALLRSQAEEGLQQRLATTPLSAEHTDYAKRLEKELEIISNEGFAGYFLIVADFVQWARRQGIPVGPGRGSGAGSLVAWSLMITDLDPLRWGLVFERFLNPERVSMPDFDIDFCQERRDEVTEYVRTRYGGARVAQIGTYGTLQARAALRDVGRVLDAPYRLVDRMCRMVPPLSGALSETYKKEAAFRALCEESELAQRVYERAQEVEGLYRHASTHAAGIVISDEATRTKVPLFRDPHGTAATTQFSMKWVEQAGLVKFDLLGLRTLTIIQDAVEMVRTQNADFDIEKIPLDDADTYKMLCTESTIGVFQLESGGMRDAIHRSRPSCLEDIIALVALYRPGPMENIPAYTENKQNPEKIRYQHPDLEPILRETYGIIVYQEQVLQIARQMSGYSLGEADELRRAMGKKIRAEMMAHEKRFLSGCETRGLSMGIARDLFALIEKFAGYGFNKAHAACYALLSYRTAWLKTHHPAEFLASLMTHEMSNTDRIEAYRHELRRLGIPLLPPSVAESQMGFATCSTESETGSKVGVRYGLGAIRNFGLPKAQAIVAERESSGAYASVEDFLARLREARLNRRDLEQLAASGALDAIISSRRQVFESAQTLVQGASTGGMGLGLDMPVRSGEGTGNGQGDGWSDSEKMRYEFAALGFYLTDHPLQKYAAFLRLAEVVPLEEVAQLDPKSTKKVRVAGDILKLSRRRSRKGNSYGMLRLSDASGSFELMLFSEKLQQYEKILLEGQRLVVDAEVSQMIDRSDLRLTVQRALPLDEFVQKQSFVSLHIVTHDESALTATMQILTEAKNGAKNEAQNGTKNGARNEAQSEAQNGASTTANGTGFTVRLTCRDSRGREAKINLPGKWHSSPELIEKLSHYADLSA